MYMYVCTGWIPPAAGLTQSVQLLVPGSQSPKLCWHLGIQNPTPLAGTDCCVCVDTHIHTHLDQRGDSPHPTDDTPRIC